MVGSQINHSICYVNSYAHTLLHQAVTPENNSKGSNVDLDFSGYLLPKDIQNLSSNSMFLGNRTNTNSTKGVKRIYGLGQTIRRRGRWKIMHSVDCF